MTVTRTAILLGVAALGFVCWLAANGVTVAYELVIAGGMLVALVAGGNLLGGRRTPNIEPYRPPAVSVPEPGPTTAEPIADAEATAAGADVEATAAGADEVDVDAGDRPGAP